MYFHNCNKSQLIKIIIILTSVSKIKKIISCLCRFLMKILEISKRKKNFKRRINSRYYLFCLTKILILKNRIKFLFFLVHIINRNLCYILIPNIQNFTNDAFMSLLKIIESNSLDVTNPENSINIRFMIWNVRKNQIKLIRLIPHPTSTLICTLSWIIFRTPISLKQVNRFLRWQFYFVQKKKSDPNYLVTFHLPSLKIHQPLLLPSLLSIHIMPNFMQITSELSSLT